MPNATEPHPVQSPSPTSDATPSEAACRTGAIVRAAIAEGLWTGLFAILPFAAGRMMELYTDYGVALPAPTMAILRFARAMHPDPHLIPYIALLFGVAMICGWLILAGAAGSPQVRRAAKFAATIMLGAGVIAWIGVAAALLVPYVSMRS